MSADSLVPVVLGGLTVAGFMVALNTQGRIKMTISYVLASVLMVCTVGVFLHSLGARGSAAKEELRQTLVEEKKVEPGRSRVQKRQANLARERYSGELREIVAHGTECANSLLTKDLKDESVELETLVGRASEMVKRVETIKSEFERSSPTDALFKEPYLSIKDGVQLLTEASQSYIQYYYSEDSGQEVERERLLRVKARSASEKFQKAGSLLTALAK